MLLTRLQSALTDQDSSSDTLHNTKAYPLLPVTSLLIRGEFNSIPWKSKYPLGAYQKYKFDDFIGPEDLRLAHLRRIVEGYNKNIIEKIRVALQETGIPEKSLEVYGRVKSPGSILLKLLKNISRTTETGNFYQLGEMIDLSGVRIDLTPTAPNFAEYYKIKKSIEKLFSESAVEVRDYLVKPSDSGYRGRLHIRVKIPVETGNYIVHEIQIGSKGITKICNLEVTNQAGQSIPLHKVSYKSKEFGINLQPGFREAELELIHELTKWNQTGKKLEENQTLLKKIEALKEMARKSLPPTFSEAPPLPLSSFNKTLRWIGKLPGPLAIFGGELEVQEGVDEFLKKRSLSALIKTGVGAANLASGAFIMIGKPLMGTVYGGGAAILQGFHQSSEGKNLEQNALGALKVMAGSLMTAGSLGANPIAVASGGLLYGGVVLYENREAIGSAIKSASRWIEQSLSSIKAYG